MKPSISEYAGNSDMFFLTVFRLREASTPVTACGYRNRASAEPSASVE